MHPDVEAFYARHAAAYILQDAFDKSRERALERICTFYEDIKREPSSATVTTEQCKELCAAVVSLGNLDLPLEVQAFLLSKFASEKIARKAGRPKSKPDQMDQVLEMYFRLHSALKDKVWRVTGSNRGGLSPRQYAAEKAQDVCRNLYPNRTRPRWDASTIIKTASSPRGKAIKMLLAQSPIRLSGADIQEILLKTVTKKN